jgi:1,4-alpha-glucan branching enzyme
MTSIGNVAIVLNAHFPYVRRAGRWPHGEESLHRVIAECYVPLLAMLRDLRPGDRPLGLTVSFSPVLLEQLADPVIAKHFAVWLSEWRDRAAADLQRFEREGNGHAAYLAHFYLDWIDTIERTFTERFGRNLANAIRQSLRSSVDVLLAPATYAYLPHLAGSSLRAQIDTGALTVLRHLGRRPAGVWLPGGGQSPMLSSIAQELGLRYGVGASWQQTVVTHPPQSLPVVHGDQPVAEHVIAAGVGYPGDGLYREFYRDHPESGIPYWRVTGLDVPIEHKDWYDPYLAFKRVEEHAEHWMRALRERLHTVAQSDPPSVVVVFDADLFGHWWFEGVRWLQSVLTRLIAANDLRLVTLSEIVGALPVTSTPADQAPHVLFDDPGVSFLRDRLKQAAQRMARAVQQRPAAEGVEEALLCQAARELLLAQSSDWPALIATGAAAEYAQRRFDEHLARFDRLLHYLERDEPTPDASSYLREIAELDNAFPFLNYRMFA